MARKHGSESSEDDARKRKISDSSEDDERDRDRDSREGGRKRVKSDDRMRSDRDRDEGRKSRQRERKRESESSEEEEGQIVSKERVREEKEERERMRRGYSRRHDEDGRGVEKERHRSREDRYNGDRWRGGDEDRRRIKDRDRRSRGGSVEEDDREFERKSERDRDRDRRRKGEKYRDNERDRHARHDSDEEDDRDRRGRVRKDGDNGRDRRDEEGRKKEDGNGRIVEEVKPPRRSTVSEGNLNGDVSKLGKSGGVYIPPFKLARMMKDVQDKSSVEYQRLTWDALRKSINGLVNKVNATNIKNIIPELFSENLIRGRGLFCRSCMKSQMASPGFTDVFAALVAVVNTKFPEVGDLLLRRIVLQLKRAYKRNDKPQLLAAVKFVAHLVNQQVAHEIIALELLTVLLEKPTDDSVEVAVGFVTECGSILQDLSPKGLHGIFERFRGILHEGEIDKRVQFLIEGLFAIRKAKFQGYPAVRPELDLVEQEDQLTHEVSLDEEIDPEISLDIFKPDPNFGENEKRYEELKKSMLGEESEDEEGSDAESDDDDDDEDDESDEDDEQSMQIKDETETNLVNLRRTIYLTIMSSVDFEEAGHKLLKIKLEPGQEMELCIMLLECCSQERTYLRYYGLLGQRFCMINKVHQENFEKCFVQQYSMIHRLETNKLRNVAKFFAHLLGTDALPWHVLSYIRLTEEDTTSSSRIFIKILFQELSEHLGIRLLNERLNDPTVQESFESIFPKDNPKNTRFCINFFTSIGLGGLTENLREYLKNMPRLIMQQQTTMVAQALSVPASASFTISSRRRSPSHLVFSRGNPCSTASSLPYPYGHSSKVGLSSKSSGLPLKLDEKNTHDASTSYGAIEAKKGNPPLTPSVMTPGGPLDLSSVMFRSRIIFIGQPVNSQVAQRVISQLVTLATIDENADILVYINCPGGSTYSVLAIYDCMSWIKPKVGTVCFGVAASQGALLLAGGEKGMRYAMPNARIMIHQPQSGCGGHVEDVKRQVNEAVQSRHKLDKMYSAFTGQPLEKVQQYTERDRFLSVAEALEFGLIDGVLETEY